MNTEKIMNIATKISEVAEAGTIIFGALTGISIVVNLGAKAVYKNAEKKDPKFLKAKAEQEEKDHDAVLEKRAKYAEEAKAWAEKKAETEIPRLEARVSELEADIRKQKSDHDRELEVLKKKYNTVVSEKAEMSLKFDNLKSAMSSIADDEDEKKSITINLG